MRVCVLILFERAATVPTPADHRLLLFDAWRDMAQLCGSRKHITVKMKLSNSNLVRCPLPSSPFLLRDGATAPVAPALPMPSPAGSSVRWYATDGKMPRGCSRQAYLACATTYPQVTVKNVHINGVSRTNSDLLASAVEDVFGVMTLGQVRLPARATAAQAEYAAILPPVACVCVSETRVLVCCATVR